MKSKTILTVLFIGLWLNSTFSQEVEKSIFGVQAGFFGGWVSHEWGFSHHWVLHSEFGLDGSLASTLTDGDFPVFLPVVSFQPRYYYNLPKRKVDGKDIFHNAGNFAAISFTLHPNWFSISNQENIQVEDGFFILPTWGIRRNINWHFYYELGIGAGFSINGLSEIEGGDTQFLYNINARIGYKIF